MPPRLASLERPPPGPPASRSEGPTRRDNVRSTVRPASDQRSPQHSLQVGRSQPPPLLLRGLPCDHGRLADSPKAMSSTAEQRQHKLDRAREKLRRFQAKQSGTDLSVSVRGSQDSLAESTTSDGRLWRQSKGREEERPPSAAASLPPSGPSDLYHDDQRSPFQRVRGPSVSSDLSSNFPSNAASPQQPSDDSTPRQEDFNSGSLAGYFGQPSQPSASGPVDFGTSLPPSELRPSDIPGYRGPQGPGNGELPPQTNGGQSLSERVDAFIQSSQPNEAQARTSEEPPSTIMSVSMTGSERTGSDSTVVNGASAEDRRRLEAEVEALKAQLASVTTEFTQLHGHYGQLHAAYSTLSAQQQSGASGATPGEAGDSAAAAQLQQALQTMSVLVEEKAELQSQLRQAMELANTKHSAADRAEAELQTVQQRLAALEREAEGGRSGKSSLEATLSRQTAELGRLREAESRLEARVVELGQDRSETQVRLRHKAKELDAAQAEMAGLRKDLHMKEIYVRQLTAAGAQPHLHQELEGRVKELEALLSQSEAARLAALNETARWKTEAAEAQAQHDTHARQLNAKLADLAAQVDQERDLRVEAQTRAIDAQTQAQLQKEAIPPPPPPELSGESGSPEREAAAAAAQARAEQEALDLRRRVAELESSVSAASVESRELSSRLVGSEEETGGLRRSLAEAKAAASRLETELEARGRPAEDSAALAAQLDGEKATASRAIAQNTHLKDQLGELQDRFVVLTQQNADLTTRLESAEHRLREQRGRSEEAATQQAQPDAVSQSSSAQEATLPSPSESTQDLSTADSSSQQNLSQARIEERTAAAAATAALEGRPFTEAEKAAEKAERAKERDLEDLRYALKRAREDAAEESQALRSRLAQQEARLAEASRASAENAELHRILQQNAADENHNTIHVELQQALDRIAALGEENNALRERLSSLDQPSQAGSEPGSQETSQEATPVQPSSEDGSTPVQASSTPSPVLSASERGRSGSLSSEALDVAAAEELRTRMGQLEQRFTRAMSQNADLSETNAQLEHLVTQLQGETETIGEYITIYQHQRKVMKERLREREEALARLSRTKEEHSAKLASLEDLVMRLLGEKGSLKAYYSLPPTRAKPPGHAQPPTLPIRIDQRLASPDSGSDSDALSDMASPASEVQGSEVMSPGSETSEAVETGEEARLVLRPPSPPSSVASRTSDGGGTAEQILRLLTELKTPDPVPAASPPHNPNLHCNQCTGSIQTL